MKTLKVGTRIIINGLIATVISKPATGSGMQAIRYDVGGLLGGYEWWEKRKLAEFPLADEQVQA